jgi:hypothetical protein
VLSPAQAAELGSGLILRSPLPRFANVTGIRDRAPAGILLPRLFLDLGRCRRGVSAAIAPEEV